MAENFPDRGFASKSVTARLVETVGGAPDLTSCDREPIHIPGAIQPHGVLLVLDEETLTIIQLSENARKVLGLPVADLLGSSLARHLTKASVVEVTGALSLDDLQRANPLKLEVLTKGPPAPFDGIMHRHDGVLIIELEPSPAQEKAVEFTPFYHAVRDSVTSLQNARTVAQACQKVTDEVFKISGFDRVCAYKFDEQWNGNVVAEAAKSGVETFLNQRFPASDVPAQARKLYTLNWLRLIVNAEYVPSVLVPDLNPKTGKPLDLSHSTLRSVSPVHLEYMKNIGMVSSMSISVIKDGKLWGLISCHGSAPAHVPYQVRQSCEFLGQIFSYQLSAIEAVDEARQRETLRAAVAEMMASKQHGTKLNADLFSDHSGLLAFAEASGAALLGDGPYLRTGETPSDAVLHQLKHWLTKQVKGKEAFVTASLPRLWPELGDAAKVASGLLAVVISRAPETYLVWFRPEIIRTVGWAGNPQKPVTGDGQEPRLHPRKSFKLWQETVRGQSAGFCAPLVEVAIELRNELLMRQITATNRSLEDSNAELETFAHIVAHDLKEPLRGIRNYLSFTLEDLAGILPKEAHKRLTTSVKLSVEMEGLLTSLYEYSRMGRVDLAFGEISLEAVLDSVLSRLGPVVEAAGVEIIRPKPLPSLHCDRVRIAEVFQNLVANAIKYNQQPIKKVEISYVTEESGPLKGQPVFYVRDNGIGIEPKHRDEVFKMFRRLHARHEYGGTGAGLAIVKRIIEKHGGRIWISGGLGEGTTFFFTLAGEEAEA